MLSMCKYSKFWKESEITKYRILKYIGPLKCKMAQILEKIESLKMLILIIDQLVFSKNDIDVL